MVISNHHVSDQNSRGALVCYEIYEIVLIHRHLDGTIYVSVLVSVDDI